MNVYNDKVWCLITTYKYKHCDVYVSFFEKGLKVINNLSFNFHTMQKNIQSPVSVHAFFIRSGYKWPRLILTFLANPNSNCSLSLSYDS